MKLKYIYKSIVPLVAVLLGGTACSDFLTEDNENGKYDSEITWNTPQLAEGVLLKAYANLPTDYTAKDDWATDDMVTNLLADPTVLMGTGGWTSRNNPLTNYAKTYESFVHINDFLAHVDSVRWSDPTDTTDLNQLYKKRLRGEAYGLRAWYGAQLLKTVGGKDQNNLLLGYPIVTSVIESVEAAKLPRNTYAECVAQIFKDCDSSIVNLPLIYTDLGLTTIQKRVLGAQYANRINGIAVRLIKSSVALRAASPAFSESGITWTQAAQLAADVMNANQKLDKLSKKDIQFYIQTDDAYLKGNTEVLWYSSRSSANSSREANNMPPSLFGKGQINPSQNLVDAFPDKNGAPITESTSTFDPLKPYENRDPRLDMYIYRDGLTTAGSPAVTIKTSKGNSEDAIDSVTTSTRTSYYMRKLMNEGVSLKPGAVVGTPHYYAYARYTEALLNFAEAANEVGGPDAMIGGFSAREVINALRTRAGITNKTYLNTITDAPTFKTIIRNERRIELCFEGFRFWDLRRWKDTAKMNETVKGVRISKDLSTISPFDVEKRVYADYMIYAPLPYDETLKYDLIQNQGW